MTCVFDSMIFSLESPLHFRTSKHAGTLLLPKNIVLPLGFSLTWPSACLISSKHSLYSTAISSSHATTQIQSYPQQEEKSRQLFNDDITEFLLKECGVFDSDLPAINRKIKGHLSQRISLRNGQQVIQLFRDSGFTPHQVRTVIRKYPYLLTCKVDGLRPKIDRLTVLGLTRKDLAMAITRKPRILGSSLKKNLNPKIRLLANLFGSEDHLTQVIKRAPEILLSVSNVTGNAAKKLKQMKNIGLLEDEIKDIFKKYPRLLCVTTETLDEKLKHVANFGLSDKEIKQVLVKFPGILGLSVDKMQKNMDFLTHTAGFEPNIVCTYPIFLVFSLENRLKPRFMFYKYLTVNQSSKRLTISLSTMLNLGDEEFSCRFLNNLQTQELYESYMSKSSDTALPE